MSVENEKGKPFQIEGFWPHELLFFALLGAALYCSQYHTEAWPVYVYTAAVLAALPVAWYRCREEWNGLPNRGFFLGLAAAWVVMFNFLGISTFHIIGSPSLFNWMFNVYSSPMQDEGHGMLVPFLVLGLVWWKRAELAAQPAREWWPAMGLVVLGLLLHVAGFVTEQPRASILGFFTGLYGLMGLAWGPRFLKAIFFPYFLLAFCVPVGELAAPLTLKLRILVATIVAGIAHLGLAPDVIREGTQLFDADHTFGYEVAPACSGIRSLVTMLILTTVWSFLCFKPVWKRAVMISAALPLAVAGNVARLCMTIMVAELFGQNAGSFVETKLGFVTFAVAIGCVVLISRWLERSEVRPAAGASPASDPNPLLS